MIHRLLFTGLGYLIAIAGFACIFITQFVMNTIMLDDEFYSEHGWPKMLGMFLAAGVSWPIGRALKRKEERETIASRGRRSQDESLMREHTLLFIPAHYWWIVFLFLGVIVAFL